MSNQIPPKPEDQQPWGVQPPTQGTPPTDGWSQPPSDGWQSPPTGAPFGPPPPQYRQQGAPRTDETGMAVVAHLSALIAQVVSVGWLSFVGPLAVWFVYKDRSPFVRACAAGAFNFNLGMWLMSIAAWISFFTVILIPLAIVLFAISIIGMFVLHIVAAVKASNGEVFNYPFQLRVLS